MFRSLEGIVQRLDSADAFLLRDFIWNLAVPWVLDHLSFSESREIALEVSTFSKLRNGLERDMGTSECNVDFILPL